MNLWLILTLLLVIVTSYTFARRCDGVPRNSICNVDRNVGKRGRRCKPKNVWYYDANTKQCLQMRYLGCGGNNNRWCSKATCESKCRPIVLI